MTSSSEIVATNQSQLTAIKPAVSLETFRNRKSVLQKIGGNGRTLKQRKDRVFWYDWKFVSVGLPSAAGIIPGFLALVKHSPDGPSNVTSSDLLASAAVSSVPLATVWTILTAYMFLPVTLQAFAVNKNAKTIEDLPTPARALLMRKVRLADAKQGWRPRQGITHPKGRDDTHDRFRVRFVATDDATLLLFLERWVYGKAWHGQEVAATRKIFTSDQQEDACAYYEQLHIQVAELEAASKQALSDKRIAEQKDAQERSQLAYQASLEKQNENAQAAQKALEKQAQVKSLVQMASVLDDQNI